MQEVFLDGSKMDVFVFLSLHPRLFLFGVCASNLDRYYAHPIVEDSAGVIAPWHSGANGPLDALIALGYTGRDGAVVKARDALLPAWTVNDTWGREYWDWDNPVMCGIVSMCGDYPGSLIVSSVDFFRNFHCYQRAWL